MLPPEAVFQFTSPKDLASGSFDLILRSISGAGPGGTVDLNLFTVPKDRVLIISTTTAFGFSTAVPVTDIQFRIILADNTAFPIMYGNVTGFPAILRNGADFSGQVWVPPNSLIRTTVIWSGADASNTASSFLTGISIPRANVQGA